MKCRCAQQVNSSKHANEPRNQLYKRIIPLFQTQNPGMILPNALASAFYVEKYGKAYIAQISLLNRQVFLNAEKKIESYDIKFFLKTIQRINYTKIILVMYIDIYSFKIDYIIGKKYFEFFCSLIVVVLLKTSSTNYFCSILMSFQ